MPKILCFFNFTQKNEQKKKDINIFLISFLNYCLHWTFLLRIFFRLNL